MQWMHVLKFKTCLSICINRLSGIIKFVKISAGIQIIWLNSITQYKEKCLVFVMGVALFLENPKSMFNRCN